MKKTADQLAREAIAEQAAVNPEFRRLLQAAMPSQPSYRFWKSESGDRYFYTTEKINHKDKPRYVAGIYRFMKTKKQYKLVKKSGFAKKYKAKDRAYQWYQQKA